MILDTGKMHFKNELEKLASSVISIHWSPEMSCALLVFLVSTSHLCCLFLALIFNKMKQKLFFTYPVT